MEIIPFKEPGSWKMQISLSGETFNMSFYWNALNEYWVMDIADADNNALVTGIKVVTNYNLTGQFIVQGMPSGSIVCQNILNQWQKIGRFDMGQTNELIYYEPGEFAV